MDQNTTITPLKEWALEQLTVAHHAGGEVESIYGAHAVLMNVLDDFRVRGVVADSALTAESLAAARAVELYRFYEDTKMVHWAEYLAWQAFWDLRGALLRVVHDIQD